MYEKEKQRGNSSMRNECYYTTTTKLWRDEPSKDKKKKLKLRSNRQPEVTVSVIQYSKLESSVPGY
jgi:hypothetical protein